MPTGLKRPNVELFRFLVGPVSREVEPVPFLVALTEARCNVVVRRVVVVDEFERGAFLS